MASQLRLRHRPLVLFLLSVVLQLRPTFVPPLWWQRGWPRERVDSAAEAELLSQLAVLLMPKTPIKELFRSFPSPEGWEEEYLEPDLAVYGALKDPDAALFVKYDGCLRHGKKGGKTRDQIQNEALLAYGPPGSYVLCISHTHSSPLTGQILEIRVCPWRLANTSSLQSALAETLAQTFQGLGQVLSPELAERLSHQADKSHIELSTIAEKFVQGLMALNGGNTTEEILQFLKMQGFKSKDIHVIQEHVLLRGQSIERTLQPAMHCLSDIGLSKRQVVRSIVSFPRILSYAEEDLTPTCRWLLDMGVTKVQVAKVVTGFPRILSLRIDHNLKPTVQWLLNMGLTKAQVAKAIAKNPRMLGCSIQQNLRPTVQWLLDLGLSKGQVAKTIATFAPILSYSIEQNLKPTVQWLSDVGLSQAQLAKAIATCPQLLGCNIEQNLKPAIEWLLDTGLTQAQVGKVIASSPQTLCLRIDQNLKPKVQWLLDIGLSKGQVAKAISTCPSILGLSIEKNLKPKQALLEAALEASDAANMISRCPQIFSYSYQRLSSRLRVLVERNETHKLVGAMSYTEESFQKRFGHIDST